MKYRFIFCIISTIFLVCGTPLLAIDQDFFGKDKSSPFYVSPVISLIVSGEDHSHLSQTLSNAVRISRRVPVRNILILHKGKGIEKLTYSPEMEDEASQVLEELKVKLPKNPYKKYFQELNLYSADIKSDNDVLNRLRISNSPTWVVRFEGEDYIYEGYSDINKLFNHNGSFMPE